jgi:hypothetical protein
MKASCRSWGLPVFQVLGFWRRKVMLNNNKGSDIRNDMASRSIELQLGREARHQS